MTSVLIKIYLWLCSYLPGFRKITSKWMYQAMGSFIKQEQWTYMNYGYAHINGEDRFADLDSSDELQRLSYQLYNHLAAEIELENKTVLEVGSGRGGGASMIKKYHKPEKMIGLDFSGAAVKLCKEMHVTTGLEFVEGDAENLPFSSCSFDAVINVESSHCYNSMDKFLAGVNKVLKPGGHFLYTDFREPKEIPELERLIARSGMKVLRKRDITPNVIKALDEDHDRRMKTISENVPKPFIRQFREFAGVKNSVVYNQFENGEMIYYSFIMQKPLPVSRD